MAVVYDNARHRKHLARLVRLEVKAEAEVIAEKATADLAAHRDRGKSSIKVERGGAADWLVSLVDSEGGAAAIEFGRAGGVDRKGRKYGPTEGKHILGRHL